MARTRRQNVRERGESSRPQQEEEGPSITQDQGQSSQPRVESMLRVLPRDHRSIKATTNVRIFNFCNK